eukprot:gnl/MRDRNA2_/MRDRNA2_16232_c0_seq2.p1 gnl/MRDRNA2_/MRDRNA2_16232_c0~~gnl/MRDRNA2_/MRDRNA2_16232_c0_seq2.p1  ORF type:complete len:712 (+),score=122.63 gnl/MRDRNA2_/MRDRNA2_16232_c0_seq2:170-2137(+)
MFEDPSDDDVALKLYFWDEDRMSMPKPKGCVCCAPSPDEKGKADSSVAHSTLKVYVQRGAMAAAEHLEVQLRGLAGGDTAEERTVATKQGVRFSKMFTTTVERTVDGKSGKDDIFESTFGWTRWSFCEKVCHAIRKYNAIFAALRPSLQFSCRQKVVFLWASVSGSILSEAIFFSEHGSASKCAERRAMMSDAEKLRLAIAIGAAATFISAIALLVVKNIMRKHAVWARGWTEDKKRNMLRRWRCKNKMMLYLLLFYIFFVFFYLFCFMLVRQPGMLLTAMAYQFLLNFILIPTIVALLVAHILTQATAAPKDGNDEPTAYQGMLRQSPGLCDFSHEYHLEIGHFGRRQIKYGLRRPTQSVIGDGKDASGCGSTQATQSDYVDQELGKSDPVQHTEIDQDHGEKAAEDESQEHHQTTAKTPDSSSHPADNVFFHDVAEHHQEHQYLKRFKRYSLILNLQATLNGMKLSRLSVDDKASLRHNVGCVLAKEAKVQAERVSVRLSAGSIQINAAIECEIEGKQQSSVWIATVTKAMEANPMKEKILEAAKQVKIIADAGNEVSLSPVVVEGEAHRIKMNAPQKPADMSENTEAQEVREDPKLSQTDKVIWPCCPRPDAHGSAKSKDDKNEATSAMKPGLNLHVKCCNVDRLGFFTGTS